MISDAQIKQYNEEGYTIVENVFSMDELNPILNEFEEIVDDFAEKAFSAKSSTISSNSFNIGFNSSILKTFSTIV